MQIYQILTIIISTTMVMQGIIKYFRKTTHYSILKLFTQIIVWGGIGIVITYPETSMYRLASFLGIKEGFNALILVGFMLILIFIFKLLGVIENLEKTINKIIRQEALREISRRKN
jgi:hypothetical protein